MPARRKKPKQTLLHVGTVGIIVDLFAGGGGASKGLEMALGRYVDIAINHDPDAIAMHKANHPYTEHYCESVWDVDPIAATRGRPVEFLWASPDCKHFSKAAGGKPRDKSIRGLAWSVIRWMACVRPLSGCMENVEEFLTWGPLLDSGFPDPERKGETFQGFLLAMTTGLPPDHPAMSDAREALGEEFDYSKLVEGLGYTVEHRELRACDYGAPTIRKRLFVYFTLRESIQWPEPTHGDPRSDEVKKGVLKPWRTAAEIIDWSIPCPSIFSRKKPLAENTLKRIAKGIKKFVLDNPKPFVINYKYANEPESTEKPLSTITSVAGHYVVTPLIARIGQTGFGGDRLSYGLETPLTTITSKAEHLLVAPTLIKVATFLTKYHGATRDKETRGQRMDAPMYTLDTSNRFALNTCVLEPADREVAFLAKHFGGNYSGAGVEMTQPLSTVTTKDHHALVVGSLMKYYGVGVGQEVDEPLHTIPTKDRFALVANHLIKMRRTNIGQAMDEPAHTITAGGLHLGLVQSFLQEYAGDAETGLPLGVIELEGQLYQIVDIGMRMLEPHELFLAQGFPPDYIINRDAEGRAYPKAAQVARCGNSVPPPFSEAIYRANHPNDCIPKGSDLLSKRTEYAEIKEQRVQLALGL